MKYSFKVLISSFAIFGSLDSKAEIFGVPFLDADFGIQETLGFKITIPESGVELTGPSVIAADIIEIKGPVWTQGHKFSVFARKLTFSSTGAIRSFRNAPAMRRPQTRVGLPGSNGKDGWSDSNDHWFRKNVYEHFQGEAGSQGSVGSEGHTGVQGEKEPGRVVVCSLENNICEWVVNIPGQDGGKGGAGGTGGSGGYGGRGVDAWANCMPNTRNRQAGAGGRGGDGGTGGRGGSGGHGGNAVPILLMSWAANSEITEDPLIWNQLRLGSGQGGSGGSGGTGGNGGLGGQGGESDRSTFLFLSSYESAGRHGYNGNTGELGREGADGNSGENGQARRLLDQEFSNLLTPRGDRTDNSRIVTGAPDLLRRREAVKALLAKHAFQILETELSFLKLLLERAVSQSGTAAFVNVQVSALLSAWERKINEVSHNFESSVKDVYPLRNIRDSVRAAQEAPGPEKLTKVNNLSIEVVKAKQAAIEDAKFKCKTFNESLPTKSPYANELIWIPACRKVDAYPIVLSEPVNPTRDVGMMSVISNGTGFMNVAMQKLRSMLSGFGILPAAIASPSESSPEPVAEGLNTIFDFQPMSGNELRALDPSDHSDQLEKRLEIVFRILSKIELDSRCREMRAAKGGSLRCCS